MAVVSKLIFAAQTWAQDDNNIGRKRSRVGRSARTLVCRDRNGICSFCTARTPPSGHFGELSLAFRCFSRGEVE